MTARSGLTIGILGATLGITALALPVIADEAADVAAVKAATEKYADVDVALTEGFVPAGACVSAELEGLPPDLGAMGVHYIHPGMLKITATEPRVDGGSTHTDFMKPAILLYEPQADGSLVLVGVENLVFQKAWQAAGHDAPPTFSGHPFVAMADDASTEMDEAHAFADHFDQHVWFRDNPSGVLTSFNPNVTCEFDQN